MKEMEPFATGWPSMFTVPLMRGRSEFSPQPARAKRHARVNERCLVLVKVNLDLPLQTCAQDVSDVQQRRDYSEEIDSPPFMLPIACQVASVIELRTKRTEPSQSEMLTPPGCRLRAAVF